MASDDDSREYAIEFGSLPDDLEGEDYPMDGDEFIEKYGGRELELEDGTQTVREVLGPLGETTYESADDALRTIAGMVSEEAVGREGYSDRGGQEANEQDEQESV